MTTVDIVLIAIIGLFGVSGLRRGLLSQVVFVVAFLVGVWLTIRLSGYASKIFILHFGMPAETTPLWAFGVTFVAVVVGVYFLAHLLKGTMRMIRVAWVDKVLGLAFGMLKGALLVSVVMALLVQGGVMEKIVPPAKAKRSVLYEPVRRVAPGIFPYLKDFGMEAWSRIVQESKEAES